VALRALVCTRKRVLGIALVFSLAPGVEHAAFAQQQVRGGFRPVFGRSSAAPAAPQPIDFDFSLNASQSYDSNLSGVNGPAAASTFVASGTYTSLVPQLDFSFRGKRTQFSATGTSTGRYYPQLHRAMSMGTNIGAGFTTQIGRATTLLVNEGVSYAPASFYNLLQTTLAPVIGATPPITANYQAASERAYTTATAIRLTHKFSDRASLELIGDYNYSTFTGHAPGYFNMPAIDGGGDWVYALNHDVKLRVGYKYHDVQYTKLLRPVENEIDFGLDYTRPLSATRHTMVGFSVSPTLVTGQFSAATTASGSQYRLTGNAFAAREIGRTWQARASYDRGVAYIQGLAGPVYNDSVNLQTGGYLNPRVDVTFSAAYALGKQAAQSGGGGNFDTYSGNARIRYALTRQWALFVDALLYNYSFDRNLIVVPGLPRQFSRDSVEAGLTLWFPMRTR
jgi:hypothetical protein